MIGPKRIINRAKRIKIYTVPMVSHWGNRTALSIMQNRDKVLAREFDDIRRKSNLVSIWAKGRGDVSWSEPDGCAVGFLSYEGELSSIEACERLYLEHKVRVIPGAFFHLEKGFRLSLAPPYDLLKEALSRIDAFLDKL
jgi:aspartate/methionine/tyrosine aminotransferase